MDKDEKLFERMLKLMEPGVSQETADFINETLKSDPGIPKRWLDKAMDLGYQGKYARAGDYLKVLYIIRGGDPGMMHIMAINTWLQGHNKSAAGMCRDLVKNHPGFTEPYLTLGNAEYGLGRYRTALRAFDRLLESEPGNLLGLCGKGMALRALGREEDATDCFAQALALEPACAEGYLGTARYQVGHSLYREALLFLERALALDPCLSEAWFCRGVALYETNRFEEALSCMDRAEGDASLAIKVLQVKAYLYHMLRNDDAAHASLDRWLELEPDNALAWYGDI